MEMNDKMMKTLSEWGGEVHFGAEVNEASELAAYRATGMEPHQIEQLKGEAFGLRVDKQKFEQLQQDGRLLVLPCKVG